jgi:peptidoglycan/LPS O-acetylase OafA/YrhL
MRYPPLRFLAARAVRIFPTYLVGSMVLLIALAVSVRIQDRGYPYALGVILRQATLAREWFGTPTIDNVSWTLEVELKFYVLAALLASLGCLARAEIIALTAVLLVIIPAVFLHDRWQELATTDVRAYQTAWVAGFAPRYLALMLVGTCFLHLLRRTWGWLRFAVTVATLLTAAALGCATGPDGAGRAMYWVSYGAAVALFAVLYCYRSRVRPTRIGTFFADISFPLYVVHGVAGYILMRGLLSVQGVPLLVTAEAIAIAIGVAWLLHKAIEVPTHTLARRVARGPRREGRRRTAPVIGKAPLGGTEGPADPPPA